MDRFAVVKVVLPIFLGFIVLEGLYYQFKGRPFPVKEALVSLVMMIAYQIASIGTVSLLQPFTFWIYDLRAWTVPMDTWWGWGLLFLGVEFFYYCLHRCAHEIRWLWASHSVHHSPSHVTLSGAYRLAITALFSGLFLFFMPLYALGFPPLAVGAMVALNLSYQFWLHTELIPPLGALELIFNTPSNHRVHHSIEDEYIDKNYGGVLMIFDHLFGTYVPERASRNLKYGLIGKATSYNPITLFFQEWVSLFRDMKGSSSIWQAIQFCAKPPGWPNQMLGGKRATSECAVSFQKERQAG